MGESSFSGVMVGRAVELGVVGQLLDVVTAGSGAALLVEGEAGIGKTRLVQALLADARSRHLRAFDGAAHPFEATRPFGAVAEALKLRRGSSDPRRAEIGRLLVGHPDGDGPPHQAPDVRYRVIQEIVDLLEVLSKDGPVLLALEDLHWADESTVAAFRTMLLQLAQSPVLLVGTRRPSPRPADLDLLIEELTKQRATFVRLGSLTDADIGDLVTSELGRPAGPGLSKLVSGAGGNPLWVVEMLRSLTVEGLLDPEGRTAEVTTAGLPDSFAQLVLRRLRYLSDQTLAALRMAAVLGDAFSLVDLATVTGRRVVDLVTDLAPALEGQLLRDQGTTLAFRHQLVHDAIYADIPEAGRLGLHQEAARVLAEAGAPLQQVAAQVMLGAAPGDVRAVGWLRAAARDALPRAPEVAIDLLTRAENLLPADPAHRWARDTVTAELVDALLRAGRVAESAACAEAVLARDHDAEVDAGLRLSLISALSLQNRAAELIIQAAAAVRDSPALSLVDRALIEAQASYGRTFSGDLVGGERTARGALELAQEAGDLGMTVWSLTTLSVAVQTQGRYGEAVELTRRAVQLASEAPTEHGRLRHPHFFLGMALSDADSSGAARDAFRRGVLECAELGSSWILPDIQQMSAELSFLLGEWDDALAEIETGLAAAAERGNQILIAQSRGYAAIIAAVRGDRPAAAAALAPVRTELDNGAPRYGAEIVAYARSLLAESDGNWQSAFDELLRIWQLDDELRIRRHHRYLAPALVRLGLALDRPATAREVADTLAGASELATGVPSLGAAALRCRGLVDNDPEPMLAAVTITRAGPRVLDHAGACEDAATVLAAVGRTEEAQALLTEALDQYEQLSATYWAVRARAALRKLGVRPGVRGARPSPAAGWESLTRTERSVAQLVAEGLTNREVGTRLYISPHTVNTHLRHVFQKLGISSRAALAAYVVRQQPHG
jgi:DNA-binding CsgD family transcriptional regulator